VNTEAFISLLLVWMGGVLVTIAVTKDYRRRIQATRDRLEEELKKQLAINGQLYEKLMDQEHRITQLERAYPHPQLDAKGHVITVVRPEEHLPEDEIDLTKELGTY
jgi:hypothetical protein